MLSLSLRLNQKLEEINATFTATKLADDLEALTSVKDSIFNCGIYRAIRVFIQYLQTK